MLRPAGILGALYAWQVYSAHCTHSGRTVRTAHTHTYTYTHTSPVPLWRGRNNGSAGLSRQGAAHSWATGWRRQEGRTTPGRDGGLRSSGWRRRRGRSGRRLGCGRGGAREAAAGESPLTAAIPADNSYYSCKLTRVRSCCRRSGRTVSRWSRPLGCDRSGQIGECALCSVFVCFVLRVPVCVLTEQSIDVVCST